MKELVSFLAIFTIDILAFASIFYYLFFSNYEDYDTLFHGIIAIIGSGLGNFSFPRSGEDFNEYLASIILVIFLFITNIILLNLLIAILSNIYTVM